jgi:Uncharacterized protein conserved in bacteria (DUF2252)
MLGSQDVARVSDLVPIRYGRMLETPFSFLRGAAYPMAADLAEAYADQTESDHAALAAAAADGRIEPRTGV